MTIRKEESTGLKYEQITQQLRERLEQEVYEAESFTRRAVAGGGFGVRGRPCARRSFRCWKPDYWSTSRELVHAWHQ
jgi:hypothetical protein